MAYRLNQNQRIAAIRHYYQCGSNATEASRHLSEEFNIHAVQGRNIKSLVNKFEITGSVNNASRSGCPITATSNEKGERLCASLINSPRKSHKIWTVWMTCLNIVVTLLLLSLFINSSYCACSSHLSYNKIYLNLQLLLISNRKKLFGHPVLIRINTRDV